MIIRAVLLSICATSSVVAIPRLAERDVEPLLRSCKYDPGNFESVVAAVHDSSYLTRTLACELLAYRPGSKSIEVLRAALQDSELQVRISAARALLALRDRSGVSQLLKDWGELVPGEAERNSTRMGQINPYTLSRALEVGLVLAESGDARALPLAEFAAEQGHLVTNRIGAVDVLCAGLKLGKAELGKIGVAPSVVLRRISGSERENTVLSTIASRLEKVPPEVAIPILEVLINSPHLAGHSKGATESALKRKQAETRGEASASQPAGGHTTIINSRPTTRPAQTQPG